MIRANARLVGEEDQRTLTLRACRNRWVFVLPPVSHPCRGLLPRAVQRTLRRESQTLHQAPNRHFAQVHVERLPDQRANDRQRPQRELKLELQRRLLVDHARQRGHLPGVELRRCAGNRFGQQGIPAAVVVRLEPTVDGATVDAQARGHRFRALAGLNSLHGIQTQLLQRLVRIASGINGFFAAHDAILHFEALLMNALVTADARG
jgi:hypothetical protein